MKYHTENKTNITLINYYIELKREETLNIGQNGFKTQLCLFFLSYHLLLKIDPTSRTQLKSSGWVYINSHDY